MPFLNPDTHVSGFLFFLALALVFAGCNGGPWPSSMRDQPIRDALTDIRPAPPGSVPVGGVEHLDDREDDQDLADPFPKDAAAVERGHDLFEIHCAICHNADGHGNGKLSKVFPPAPDLRHITICHRTDGFIYGTITAGGRAMPSLRYGLSSHDRWDLVAFVRNIQSQGCVNPEAAQAPGGATGGTP